MQPASKCSSGVPFFAVLLQEITNYFVNRAVSLPLYLLNYAVLLIHFFSFIVPRKYSCTFRGVFPRGRLMTSHFKGSHRVGLLCRKFRKPLLPCGAIGFQRVGTRRF